MADYEEPDCGCVISPYRVQQNPKCQVDHEDQRKALHKWRENRLWGGVAPKAEKFTLAQPKPTGTCQNCTNTRTRYIITEEHTGAVFRFCSPDCIINWFRNANGTTER